MWLCVYMVLPQIGPGMGSSFGVAFAYAVLTSTRSGVDLRRSCLGNSLFGLALALPQTLREREREVDVGGQGVAALLTVATTIHPTLSIAFHHHDD